MFSLKKNGFSYDVYEVNKIPVVRSQTAKTLPYQIPEKDKEKNPNIILEYTFHRIDIDFVNSNSKVELITEQKSTDFDNYYNIPNKPEGITGFINSNKLPIKIFILILMSFLRFRMILKKLLNIISLFIQKEKFLIFN